MINYFSTKDKGRIVIEDKERVSIYGPNGSTIIEWVDEELEDFSTCAKIAISVAVAMGQGTDILKKRLGGDIGI